MYRSTVAIISLLFVVTLFSCAWALSTVMEAELTPTLPCPANADDFSRWLGEQLDKVGQTPIDNNQRLEDSRDLVQKAIACLDAMSTQDRKLVLTAIVESSETQMIGRYRIPYDDRDTYDWVEGILATLEGHLEGQVIQE